MKRNIYLVSGVICILYYIILTSVMGQVAFSKVFPFIGVIFLLYGIFYKTIESHNYFFRIIKVIESIIFLGIIIFILVQGFIVITSIKRDKSSSDYLIVLGAGLKGENMTLSLKERMDTTLEYLKKYGDKDKVILSGGKGPGESISESLAMKRYLVDNGINEDRIIIEEKSRNTYENLRYSKEIIEKYSNNSIDNYKVKIITSNYHGLRAKILAERLGYKNITLYTSRTHWLLAPNYFFREFFALVKSFVFDK
ncbi:YdcF family protein [Clostridium hydrogeniformans]|uniref:YdcF family protein n=1 Tax=Clostridium hydrogeniformans TaxID=349933 RepID=UPI00047FC11A|nr:YdcF family protein [Clostridium hydrogeniformans]